MINFGFLSLKLKCILLEHSNRISGENRRFSLDFRDIKGLMEEASSAAKSDRVTREDVESVLDDGLRTIDIQRGAGESVGTEQMGNAVISKLSP